jgi:hypothetical protein
MVQIEPIQIWINGQNKTASIFDCYGIGFTLGVQAKIYYALYVKNEDGSMGEQVAQGNLDLAGEDYQLWGDDDNYVWEWGAGKLNLTIIGDFEAPSNELQD